MGNTKHRLPDIGDRHGRLVVCTEPQHIKSIWFINCKCDCGELVQVRHHHWVSGHTRSCGCMAAGATWLLAAPTPRTTHGNGTEEREFLYASHGGYFSGRRKMPHKDTRPVVEGKRKCNVCELPVPVENFAKDSADKYGIRKTCKPCQRGVDALRALRTAKPPKYKSVAAALNLPPGPKRNSVMLTAFGETMCLSNWANDPRCVVNYATLNYRVKALWDHQEAITTKAQ